MMSLLPARAAPANAPPSPSLPTGNPLGKHPGTITINPTPGNTPRPRARTKTSLSITGESYSPTNRSFLAWKSSGPLSHYALEVARLKTPPASTATSAGARVLVCGRCKMSLFVSEKHRPLVLPAFTPKYSQFPHFYSHTFFGCVWFKFKQETKKNCLRRICGKWLQSDNRIKTGRVRQRKKAVKQGCGADLIKVSQWH